MLVACVALWARTDVHRLMVGRESGDVYKRRGSGWYRCLGRVGRSRSVQIIWE